MTGHNGRVRVAAVTAAVFLAVCGGIVLCCTTATILKDLGLLHP